VTAKEKIKIRSLSEIPQEEHISSGTIFCQGCGGLLAARLFLKGIGSNTVIVNAAGCFTLSVIYPFSPFDGSWLYAAMACAPAGAQGVRDAIDILKEKGRRDAKDDLQVVVITGDGAASSIGLQSTLTAIHRGLDFWYLCYDNQAFMNTGAQQSDTTPFSAVTSTSKPTGMKPIGVEEEAMDLFSIWNSMKPRYLATVSISHPIDFLNKVQAAHRLNGPKLFIAFSPCPPGWDFNASRTLKLAKLAVETGVYPLKESVNGEVLHTYVPKRRLPVEKYLETQGRFEYLFHPGRRENLIKHIQKKVNAYWESLEK